MKNWKKWAAGLFALSLCLTSVSLPAAAEGEEDIALIADTSEETPVADGTPEETAGDGEADAEEEATRTETQEELEITGRAGHPVYAEEELLRRHHILLPSGGL